jgi:hypothetical protein
MSKSSSGFLDANPGDIAISVAAVATVWMTLIPLIKIIQLQLLGNDESTLRVINEESYLVEQL